MCCHKTIGERLNMNEYCREDTNEWKNNVVEHRKEKHTYISRNNSSKRRWKRVNNTYGKSQKRMIEYCYKHRYKCRI